MPGPEAHHVAPMESFTPAALSACKASVRTMVSLGGGYGRYTGAAADNCECVNTAAGERGAGYHGTAMADSRVRASRAQCCLRDYSSSFSSAAAAAAAAPSAAAASTPPPSFFLSLSPLLPLAPLAPFGLPLPPPSHLRLPTVD